MKDIDPAKRIEIHTEDLKGKTIYKISPVNRKGKYVPHLKQEWDNHNLVSISDGGVSSNAPLIQGKDVHVNKDTITRKAAAPFNGTFEWKYLRDMMIRSDGVLKPIAENHAAKVAGSIIRFVEDLQRGTIVVADFADTLVPGVISDSCRYNPDSPVTTAGPTHVFQRSVQWSRTENGNLRPIQNNDTTFCLDSGKSPIQELTVEL